MSRTLAALAFLTALLAFASGAQPATPELWKFCNGFDVSTVITACNQILAGRETDADRSRAFTSLGNAYKKKGDRDRALDALVSAIELDPTNAAAFVSRGILYGVKGDWDHAIADYTRGIELDPTDRNAFTLRGNAYGKKGDKEHRDADFGQGDQLREKLEKELTAKLKTGKLKHDDALNAQLTLMAIGHEKFTLALAESLPPLSGLAWLESNLESNAVNQTGTSASTAPAPSPSAQPPAAAPAPTAPTVASQPAAVGPAKKVKSPPPSQTVPAPAPGAASAVLWYNCQNSYYMGRLGAIEACTTILNDGNVTGTNRVLAYQERAHLYLEGLDFDLAIADFTRAIELDPNNFQSLNMREVAIRKKRLSVGPASKDPRSTTYNPAVAQRPPTVEQPQPVVPSEPASVAPSAASAPVASQSPPITPHSPNEDRCSYRNDSPDDVIAACTERLAVVTKDDERADAFYWRQAAFQEKGDWDRAIADLSQVIELKPNAPDFVLRGITFEAKKGDYDRAIQDYTRAIALNPNSATAFAYRGTAYRHMGILALARADLTKALQLKPNDPDLMSDLAELEKDEAKAGNTNYNPTIAQRLPIIPTPGVPSPPTPAQAAVEPAKPAPAVPQPTAHSAAPSLAGQPQPVVPSDEGFAVEKPIPAPSSSSTVAAIEPAKPAVTEPQLAPVVPPAISVPFGKRVALVVGNDDYETLPDLKKAVNDAHAVGAALTKLGFEVLTVENASRRSMNTKLAEFADKVGRGDTAFFFFAGHGVQIGGTNYLMPTDTPEAREGQERLVMGEGIPADGIVQQVQERGAKVAMLVLDACRDNPFAKPGTRGVGGTRGLTMMTVPEGVFVIYSAGIGETALDRLDDNDPNPNSVFTRTFVELLGEPGLTVHSIAKRTQQGVHELASSVSHAQMPAYYDQILGELTLLPSQ
jgi:tetratricopeptide (TPR) repeat protein